MAVPFTDVDQLAAGWRPLSTEERVLAAVLIDRASRLVRNAVPGIDSRTDLEPLFVGDIVLRMVQRAMTATDIGVESASTSVGGVSVSRTFGDAAGGLYLSARELEQLTSSGSPRAFSISTI